MIVLDNVHGRFTLIHFPCFGDAVDRNGFLKDAVSTVAAKYPQQNFCYIDASVDLPNIANYECAENEGGFLIGVLCALAEKEGLSPMFNAEKRFGFIGGVNNVIINRFAAGFIAGARYVDKSYTFDVNYVGGFADTTTAKAIATTMYDSGCDVIFHAAGGSGIGMFNAAQEKKFIAVGVNTNQNSIAPDYIIASMLKRVDNAAYAAIESVVKGTFQAALMAKKANAKELFLVHVPENPDLRKRMLAEAQGVFPDAFIPSSFQNL